MSLKMPESWQTALLLGPRDSRTASIWFQTGVSVSGRASWSVGVYKALARAQPPTSPNPPPPTPPPTPHPAPTPHPRALSTPPTTHHPAKSLAASFLKLRSYGRRSACPPPTHRPPPNHTAHHPPTTLNPPPTTHGGGWVVVGDEGVCWGGGGGGGGGRGGSGGCGGGGRVGGRGIENKRIWCDTYMRGRWEAGRFGPRANVILSCLRC